MEILSEKKSAVLFKLIGEYHNSKNIKKGINETIKAIKDGSALCVVLANDSVPMCLTDSITLLCEQQGTSYVYVQSKDSLGKACKLPLDTISVAIVEKKNEDNTRLNKDFSEFL